MNDPDTKLEPVELMFLDRLGGMPVRSAQESILFDFYRFGWNDAVNYMLKKGQEQVPMRAAQNQSTVIITLVCATILLFLFLIFYMAPWLRSY